MARTTGIAERVARRNKLLVVRNAQGDVISAVRCVSFTDRPTVTVVNQFGDRVHWIADVVEIHPDALDMLLSKRAADG